MQRLTRRDVVRGTTFALAGAVVAGPTAVAAATASRAGTAVPAARTDRSGQAPVGRADDVPDAFDEMYLGRHIEGWPAMGGEGGHGAHHMHGGAMSTSRAGDGAHPGHAHRSADAPAEPVEFVVRVDDDDLHVMQNADGTWISVVNHYQTYATPRAAARAAVRELHGASLVPVVA
ncbi:tyrosinase family oxidase copper chaperone [Streptomyces sp. NPDC002004]